jgi:Domain of unknown function (DUF4160)
MPEISRFFGIVIRMFAEAGERHSRPHFHAQYQEHAAVYDIESIARLDGLLPIRQERLVVAWAEIHRDELRCNWEALQGGQRPARIEPLR